jgi:parallel beta-helix repeat protein
MITSGFYPNLVVLDVRTQGEYDSGHIYRAVWIPVSELEVRIGELAGHENHEIIVYCKSGVRSATASQILVDHDFTKVYNMLGGITAWQSAGYPVWISTVHNVNTTFNYDTIQAAIDAPQTLDGHKITVDAGTYHEHVVVKKTLSLIGENRQTTIIDGSGTETVVCITANNVTITGFTIQNGSSGLISEYCNGSVVSGNLMLNNQMYGIEFYCSNNNTVEDNVASKNGYGIRLRRSTNNTLRNNNLTNNYRNFAIEGEPLSEFIHKIDTSNVVDGKPIHYLVNQQNKQIPVQAGYVAAINSINITVRNTNLTKNSQGVLFLNTTDSTIENVNASDNSYGIVLASSNHTKVIGNTILHASEENIRLGAAANNEIIGNTVGFSARTGIYLYQSRNNTIYHNNFIQNRDQVYSEESINTWDGGYPFGGNYWSDYTGNDTLSGHNQDQLGSDGIGDTPYVIDENNKDSYPLMIPWGYTISIESNTTITNAFATRGALHFETSGPDGTIGYINVTLPVDLNKTAIIVFVDDIEITPPPFPIITTNSTHYFIYFEFIQSTHEITIKYGIVDIAINNVAPCKRVVGEGYTLNINVIIQNQGDSEETFNVTAYYNETAIILPDGKNYTTITLTSLNSTALTFIWNTTGVAKGNYTIKAHITPLPTETDTTDNTHVDGTVLVTILGDVNGDHKVNMKDLYSCLILRFGCDLGEECYVPNYDINGDGKINMADIYIAILHFGEEW